MDKNSISIDKEKPKFYGLFMFLYQNVNLIVNTAHCTNRAGSPVFIGVLRSVVLSQHCTDTTLNTAQALSSGQSITITALQ